MAWRMLRARRSVTARVTCLSGDEVGPLPPSLFCRKTDAGAMVVPEGRRQQPTDSSGNLSADSLSSGDIKAESKHEELTARADSTKKRILPHEEYTATPSRGCGFGVKSCLNESLVDFNSRGNSSLLSGIGVAGLAQAEERLLPQQVALHFLMTHRAFQGQVNHLHTWDTWLGGVMETNLSATQIRRMSAAKVTGSEVKVGNTIERKGRMYEVVKTQHTQQGRGGATIQVELRDVQSGLKTTEKLRTSEAIQVVFVDAKPFSFLYTEGDVAHFMEPNTFEQLTLPLRLLEDKASLLKEGMQVHVKYFNGEPLMVNLPARVTALVVEAEPHVKGNTATPSYKKVTLEGGLTVQVPPFVVQGDSVVVDTTNMTYVTRA